MNFRHLRALFRKEVRLFLKRPAQLAVLVLTPLAFIFVIGQTFGSDPVPTVAIYTVDEDASRQSARVIDALQDVKTLEVEILATRAEADLRVGEGQRMAAVVVPKGFSDALLTDAGAQIEVIVDPARQQTAGVVTGQVQAATAPLLIDAEVTRSIDRAFAGDLTLGGAEINLEGTGLLSEDVERFLTAALRGVVTSQVEEAIDNPLVRSVAVSVGDPGARRPPPTIMDFLVPGYAFFFGFFIVGMLGEQALAERSQGTWRRLRTLPAARTSLLLGRALPYLALSLAQLLVVMTISVIVFDFDLGDSLPAYLVMVLAGATAIAGVATFVSVVARTEGQAGSLPDLINLGMAVSSGMMFPSIHIPVLEYFTPHYWAVRGIQDVTVANLGVSEILPEAGTLLLIAAGFFGVASWRFARE